MANYRATITNERGKETSRLGHKELETHICSWTRGIRTYICNNKVEVYTTGGSNNPRDIKLIYEDEI